MYISQKNKYIFVHNPKTAGSAIIESLGFVPIPPSPLAHVSSRFLIERVFQEHWSEFFSFSFVRSPVARMISLYEFQKSSRYGLLSNHNLSHRLATRFRFEDWVDYNRLSIDRANWFGVPQQNWWDRVSKVYRFEDMAESIRDISGQLGVDIILSKSNIGEYSKDNYRNISSEILDFINEVDSDSVSRFGY